MKGSYSFTAVLCIMFFMAGIAFGYEFKECPSYIRYSPYIYHQSFPDWEYPAYTATVDSLGNIKIKHK
jgi:hypothetical protein